MDQGAEHFFMILLAICISFFGEMTAYILSSFIWLPFKNSLVRVLKCILNISSLSDIKFADISSLSVISLLNFW